MLNPVTNFSDDPKCVLGEVSETVIQARFDDVWAEKAEIRTRKEFLAVGEASKPIF